MRKVIVAVQRWEGDTHEAETLLTMMAGIASLKRGNGMNVVDFYRADAPPLSNRVKMICESSFEKFRTERSFCRDQGWPAGCNGLWHNLMVRAKQWENEATHILTIEPDVTILDTDWIEKIEEALEDEKGIGWYNDADKNFCHYNGNAVWPINLTTELVPQAQAGCPARMGWDLYWYKAFAPHLRPTNLIRAEWRMDTVSVEKLRDFRKGGAVLLHGVKDDSKWKSVELFSEKGFDSKDSIPAY